ncbi:unnamed protein product [Meloidogyne enterolobii]|uniref:Uncharacterized protein n=1 Tax=Meloidogyne enterolobii TaxID=390850 RepID=A0ACB0YBD4_MELEN
MKKAFKLITVLLFLRPYLSRLLQNILHLHFKFSLFFNLSLVDFNFFVFDLICFSSSLLLLLLFLSSSSSSLFVNYFIIFFDPKKHMCGGWVIVYTISTF